MIPTIQHMLLLSSKGWQQMKDCKTLCRHILAHGSQTIHGYFNLLDDMGGGYLKKKLRKIMGISDPLMYGTVHSLDRYTTSTLWRIDHCWQRLFVIFYCVLGGQKLKW